MSLSRLKLHALGPEFSRMAWGAWRLDKDGDATDPHRFADKIAEIVDLGITTFDHAAVYGGYTCETLFGDAIRARPGLKSRIEIVTKAGIALVKPARPQNHVKHYDTSKAHLIASCEKSLANLGVDAVDLFLLHRPDPLMDADEVAEALAALRQAGKIRHAGVSNFTPWQFELLQSRLDFPLVTNQVEHSVLHLDPLHDGTMDQCQRLRIKPMVWSPLGRAELFNGGDARHERLRKVLGEIAGETGSDDIAQVALAFILRHPACPLPILGIRQNRAAGEHGEGGQDLARPAAVVSHLGSVERRIGAVGLQRTSGGDHERKEPGSLRALLHRVSRRSFRARQIRRE